LGADAKSISIFDLLREQALLNAPGMLEIIIDFRLRNLQVVINRFELLVCAGKIAICLVQSIEDAEVLDDYPGLIENGRKRRDIIAGYWQPVSDAIDPKDSFCLETGALNAFAAPLIL
jgi:hypothetical protein